MGVISWLLLHGLRKAILLSLVLQLLGRITTTQGDNPTSIVAPFNGSDPGYIIAESTSGLANRLRVLAAYMYVAQYKYDDAHLVFIWDKNSACPGHFLSVFEPIPHLIFATNASRYVLDKHAKVVYENSYAVFDWIMRMNGVPRSRFGHPSWGQIHYLMFSRFHPTREVMSKALSFVERHHMCNNSAMHLRTTDLDSIMPSKKKINLQAYFKFVESKPPEEKVFLLTDDPRTQRLFLGKYGTKKILVFGDIKEQHQQLPLFITDARQQQRGPLNASLPLPTDHRHTTLEHTLIDVIIAAHSKEFKPSPFSSLSDLVNTFESIGKRDRGWCS